MTERLIGETGSRKRRRFLFVPIVLVACIALFVVAGAQAVHDETFQLDGNTVTGAPTNIGGHTQNVDWDSLFDANGDTVGSLPAGFGDANLVRDFQTSGNNLRHERHHNVRDREQGHAPDFGLAVQLRQQRQQQDRRDEFVRGHLYGCRRGRDPLLRDRAERQHRDRERRLLVPAISGWLLVDRRRGQLHRRTSGRRSAGRVRVLGGGTVSTINAYRWDRPDEDLPGSLNPTPVANGVDCRGITVGTEDPTCGAANTGTITTPWLTAQKTTVGHTLGTALFFEAGLNLTDSGLGGQCFSTFLGDTRSSTSLTATLFDFSGGTLGECGVSVTTTPSQSTRVLGWAAPITDLADISGTGAGGSAPTPTGTMTFFLCAPSQVTAAGCPAGAGTQVGTAVTLGACSPAAAGHACATSANAASLITATTGLGTYCFRAVYDPGSDPNYQGKGGSFTANPGDASPSPGRPASRRHRGGCRTTRPRDR